MSTITLSTLAAIVILSFTVGTAFGIFVCSMMAVSKRSDNGG
jgi:hypothetical protein